MIFSRPLFTGTAISLVLASPALADLTAEQVLADQLKQMETYGLKAEVTGQSRSGDTLLVEGLSADVEAPEGAMNVRIGGAMFRELGDGTVEISYPDTVPVSISGTAPEGEKFEMVFSVVQSGTRTVASGIPEEMRYDFVSESISITDMRFLAPEEAVNADFSFDFTMSGLQGVMELIGGGTVRDYNAEFDVASLTGSMSGKPEDESGGSFRLEFQAADLATEYDGTMAPQDIMASFADAIQAGNKTKGSASHGAVTYTMAAEGPDGSFETATAVASGSLDFAMNENGLSYGGNAQDVTTTIGGSTIPLPPLTFRVAETGGRLAVPLVPSEDEQGFALSLNLAGLEIDDMLWGMIDPVGQIPRDPANLIVDLGGQVVMAEDVFAPDFAEEMSGPPGQINSLNINRLLFNLAGAELTGDGNFSFNNEGPMPRPAGSVNLMLTGANGLMDTLVGMGLLPEEQAMGFRMMMGMFAVPGDGPDSLKTTIEFQENGAILANGQRIQ